MSISLSEPRPPFTRPLALWLMMQVLSLVLSAMQIRLSWRWIDPAQNWAVEQMLTVQFIGISLILLDSFRSFSFSVSAFFTGVTMLAFAHAIAAGKAQSVGSMAALGLWIWIVHCLSKAWVAKPLCAALTLWTLGGVLLQYLAIEFGSGSERVFCSPLLAAITLAHDPRHWGAWLLFGLTLIATLIALKVPRWLRKAP